MNKTFMFAVGRSGWRYEKFVNYQAEPVKVLRLGRFWVQWEQSEFSKVGHIKELNPRKEK